MTIIPKWDNDEKTIINISFHDTWTWEEHQICVTTGNEMLASVDYIVDFIIDFRDSSTIPPGALRVGRQLQMQALPNEGISVLVGTSPLLHALFRSFITLYPRVSLRYFVVNTLEEAYAKITEIQQKRQDNT